MNKWDSFVYLKKVDKQVQLLRERCLGYHVSLPALLPKNCAKLSAHQLATQLAQQLLFRLVEHYPDADRDELEHSWQWLHAMLLYLFEKCSAEDQTVGKLVKLAGMDYFARRSLYRNIVGIDRAVLDDLVAPTLLENLDTALLTLLDQHGKLEKEKEMYKQLEALL